jgi:hypothetical protein
MCAGSPHFAAYCSAIVQKNCASMRLAGAFPLVEMFCNAAFAVDQLQMLTAGLIVGSYHAAATTKVPLFSSLPAILG